MLLLLLLRLFKPDLSAARGPRGKKLAVIAAVGAAGFWGAAWAATVAAPAAAKGGLRPAGRAGRLVACC